MLQRDPLPSWNDTAAKRAIVELVDRVTDEGSADFVAPRERIAVFDNDGTLWCEQPMPAQAAFALDRVRALADQHPEWAQREPFRSAMNGDVEGIVATGEKGIVELVMATHAGMTTDEFDAVVADWLRNARHPRFQRPYDELVYQPMLELLAYLRANGFATYVVSGGGVEFMRVFTERTYGIPRSQVIGSSIKLRYEERGGEPVLVRLPEAEFIDNKDGKPVGIHKLIGARPLMAFGNSDGDRQMLQWTTAGEGPRFGLLVRHTDDVREYAYDRASHVGKLDRALTEASARGWTIVDMERDWRAVFPRAQAASTPAASAPQPRAP